MIMRFYLLFLFSTVSLVLQGQSFYTIERLCEALDNDMFAARYINNQIYVISYDNDSSIALKNEKPFTEVMLLSDCHLEPAFLFSAKHQKDLPISSLKHDGPISSSKSGNVLFFSNNSDNDLAHQMGIFYLKQSDSGWSESIKFPYNSSSYSCIHPFYDEQGQKLYFASNMPASTNSYSIYYVSFDGENFGEVVPFQAINSVFNDVFPSVYQGVVYFTSDRDGGYGGMDIYQYVGDSVYLMPDPINSPYDDLAYTQINKKNAFVSSNRLNEGVSDATFRVCIKTDNKIQELLAQHSRDEKALRIDMEKQGFFEENTLNHHSKSAINSRKIIQKVAQDLIDYTHQIQREITVLSTVIWSDWDVFSEDLYELLFSSCFERIDEKLELEESIYDLVRQLSEVPVSGKNVIVDQIISQLKNHDSEIAFELLPKLEELKTRYTQKEEQLKDFEDKVEIIKDLTIIALRQQALQENLTNEAYSTQNRQKIESLGLTTLDITEHAIGRAALELIVEKADIITFLFDFDSYVVNKDYNHTISELIQLAIVLDGLQIQIEGHTDNVGTVQYNNALSEKRALAIKKQLAKNGLQTDIFLVKHFGMSKPKSDNKTRKGRKLNRRVEIKLVLQD